MGKKRTSTKAICIYCGKTYPRYIYEIKIGKKKFCSNGCRSKQYKKDHTKPCEICGTSFFQYGKQLRDQRRFCSTKCFGEWSASYYVKEKNSRWKYQDVYVVCKVCGKSFLTKKPKIEKGSGKFCSRKCYGIYASNTYIRDKNHCWKGGLSFQKYTLDWDINLKNRIRSRDWFMCRMCGQKGNHVHHIDYNKKNCNDNNLITLCLSCHMRTNHNRELWTKKLNKMMEER